MHETRPIDVIDTSESEEPAAAEGPPSKFVPELTVAAGSYHMTKGFDEDTKRLFEETKARGAALFHTTSVPPHKYAAMESEVASLTPKQRKKWKSVLQDTFGQKTAVRYNEAGVPIHGKDFTSHFENKMSGQKQGKLQTNQQWRPVIPIGLPMVDSPEYRNVLILRRGSDSMLDGMTPQEQSAALHADRIANYTGNHDARDHPVRVPTRPGEPVRG